MPDTKVEYRVRPVTRYNVTRYHETIDGHSGGIEGKGEFDNADTAYEVAYALCKDEHERLGYPIGDLRVIYPEHPDSARRALPVQESATARTTGR